MPIARSGSRDATAEWRASVRPSGVRVLMHLAMVRSTHQRQVGQGGRTAPGPEQQVMTIAPDRQPVAAGEDTVLIACSERPTGCRRNAPAGVSDLLIEFAQPGDARDGGITGEPLDRRRRDHRPRVEPRRRRARNPRQGVYVGRDDELWPWTGAVARELARPPADLDQGVGPALSGRAIVLLAWHHVRVERGAQRRATLRIEEAVYAYQARPAARQCEGSAARTRGWPPPAHL